MYIWYQLLVIANYVPGILVRVYMYVLIYLKQTNGAVYAYSVEYRGGCWNVSLRIYVTPGCTPKEVADLGSEEETVSGVIPLTPKASLPFVYDSV